MNQDWKNYKRIMENQSLPKVPDHIWENVKPYIPKKKKRRAGLFLPLMAGVALGLTSVIYIYFQSEKSPSQDAHQVINTNQSAIRDNSLMEQNNNIDNNTLTNNTEKSFVLENAAQKKIINKNKKLLQSDGHPIAENDLVNENQKSMTDVGVDRNIENIIPLSVASPDFIEKDNSKLQFSIPAVRQDCYDFSGRKKGSLFLEAYAGPSFSPFILKKKNEEINTQYELRKSSERVMLSGMGGIKAGLQFKKLSLRAGLEYHCMYEQMNFTDPNYKKIEQIFIGGQLVRIDTINGSRLVQVHNYHHLVSLPLSVGYELFSGKRRLIAQAGIGVHILARHRGAIQDTALQYTYFTTGKNPLFDIYKTQVGLSGFISLQYAHPIGNKLHFLVEPAFQYYFNSFSKPVYAIDQKYFNVHTKIGIRYTF